MPQFRYIGNAPPMASGKYKYRVRQAGFEIEFSPGETFTIPETEPFVLKCIRGQMEYDWDTRGQIQAYEEIVS
jgi:hypothetical protein